jgi:starch synthase
VYGTTQKMPELLGLVMLESMACGTPVVCTDVGGMPEFVEEGVTGFIVPPNDPRALRERINYLLQNPEAALKMGRAGRRAVSEKFTWDVAARRCLAAYAGR